MMYDDNDLLGKLNADLWKAIARWSDLIIHKTSTIAAFDEQFPACELNQMWNFFLK